MRGGTQAGRVLAVVALLATIFVTLPANAQDEPDDVEEICIRVRGRVTSDLTTGELSGRLGPRGSRYPLTGATSDNGDGTFTQRYVLDVGPFLTVRETPTGSFPLRGGATLFLSLAEVTGGATSGTLAYVGRINRAGTTARYEIFGRVCGWGPDVVLTNGAVHTVAGSVEQAVAIQDDRIIAVGSDAAILSTFIAGSTPDVIDVGGRAVIPAFVDAHSHLYQDELMEPTPIGVEDRLFRNGVTTIGEPTALTATIADLRRWESAGLLRIRTRLWIAYNTCWGEIQSGAPHLASSIDRDPGALWSVLGTKIFADGGSCGPTPAISFPYLPGPDLNPGGPQGDLYLDVDELEAAIAGADAPGHQVVVHAIGDVGVETALGALAQVIGDSGNPNRHRIEHNVLVRPELIQTYVDHDIGAVIFGEYFACRHNIGGWWGQHLDPTQFDWLYPWRDMVDAGVRIGWQADYPTFTENTLHQWWSLVTIGEGEGEIYDEDGVLVDRGPCLVPELRSHGLSLGEALEAMTLGSARQLHLDTEVGSIEVGKAADLVILSNDPFSTGENTLLDASVLWTMTRGEVVHDTGGL
ncbi:MAG: amidohydrolase family protein [Actinomycetota bacterium]